LPYFLDTKKSKVWRHNYIVNLFKGIIRCWCNPARRTQTG